MQADTFRKHKVWSIVASTRDITAKIDALGDAPTSAQLDELRGLFARTEALKENVEMDLVTDSKLSSLAGAWQTIFQQLQQFLSNPDAYRNYLDSAVQASDQVRETLALIPTSAANPASRAALTRSTNQLIEELRSSRDAMQAATTEAVAAANRREAVAQAEAQKLAEELAAVEAELKKLRERIGTDESRLDTALTTTNEAFTKSQSTREKEFRDWLGTQESTFGETAAPYLDGLRQSAAQAETDRDIVAGLRTSTTEIAHLAAGDALSNQFADYAKSERRAGYLAYLIGVVAAVGGVLILLFAFGTVSAETEFGWTQVVLKLGLTVGAGGISTVAFRYGGKAIQRATSFKRQELELRALQPFLKDVTGADEAKTAFVGRAFGRAWEESSQARSEPDLQDTLLKLATAVAQNTPKSTAT